MTGPTPRRGRPVGTAPSGGRNADAAPVDADTRRWPSRRFSIDPASSPTPTAALAWFIACQPVG